MTGDGGKALALLQDVLFDMDGEYYIAAPLDSKDDSALALERLALVLEAVWLIALTSAANAEQAKAKLKNRNSRFSACHEFRVYQVESGAWAHILELIGAPEPLIKAARITRAQQTSPPLLLQRHPDEAHAPDTDFTTTGELYNEPQFRLRHNSTASEDRR